MLFRVIGRTVGSGAALAAMLCGFGVTVLFFVLGSAPPGESILSRAAHLPGDPFERVVRWIAPLLILAFSTRKPL